MILQAFYFAAFPNQETALPRVTLFITPINEFNLIKICLPTMSDIILSDSCFLYITTILL